MDGYSRIRPCTWAWEKGREKGEINDAVVLETLGKEGTKKAEELNHTVDVFTVLDQWSWEETAYTLDIETSGLYTFTNINLYKMDSIQERKGPQEWTYIYIAGILYTNNFVKYIVSIAIARIGNDGKKHCICHYNVHTRCVGRVYIFQANLANIIRVHMGGT